MVSKSEEIYKYLPLWGIWDVEQILGRGSSGSVYKIVREEMGYRYYAAAKIISIPNEEQYREAVSSVDADPNALVTYFDDAVKSIVEEIKLLYKLKGNSNIVGYEDHLVIKKEDDIGWDIIIRMELLKPLHKYLEQKKLTRNEILKIGIDICSALEVCKNSDIIHRDIKYENIFVSDKGIFKLGDFSIAKDLSKAGLAASIRGTPLYMAPEVYKGQAYDASADIYSLGLVLYKLFNYGRLPFLPEYPKEIKFKDNEHAIDMRMSGEKMQNPPLSNQELGSIILKACSFNRSDRYKTASEFKEILLKAQNNMNSEELNEEVTVIKSLNYKTNTTYSTHNKCDFEEKDNSIFIQAENYSTLIDSKEEIDQEERLNQTVSIYSEKMPIEQQEDANDLNSTQYIPQVDNKQGPGTKTSEEMLNIKRNNSKKIIASISIAIMVLVLSIVIISIVMKEEPVSQNVDGLVATASENSIKPVDSAVNSIQSKDTTEAKPNPTKSIEAKATKSIESTLESAGVSTKGKESEKAQSSSTKGMKPAKDKKDPIKVKPDLEQSIPNFSVSISADYTKKLFIVTITADNMNALKDYQYRISKINGLQVKISKYPYQSRNVLFVPFSDSNSTNIVKIECSIKNNRNSKVISESDTCVLE